MEFLSLIFFTFLGICAVVACFRSGKVVIRMINNVFDKIEDKFS